MKSVKYTLAALAVIALASVSTAQAQVQGVPGDVVLGVFNTTNSLEFDLGAYSTLSNGESWDLGNVTSVAGSNLSFSLAASSAGATTGAGGLIKAQIALAGINLPATSPTLTSEIQAITTTENNFSGTAVAAANGHSGYAQQLQAASASSSYAFNDNGNGFGLGGANNIDQSWTGNDTADLFTLLKSGSPVETGAFTTTTVDGDTILTFNSLASTPEPSAYALGLCAVALFFVLKRRSKVA